MLWASGGAGPFTFKIILTAALAMFAASKAQAQQPFDIGVEVVAPAQAISGSTITLETKITNRYTKAHPKDAEIQIIGVFEKQKIISAKWTSPGVVNTPGLTNACQTMTGPASTSGFPNSKFPIESVFNCMGKLTADLDKMSQIVITSEVQVTAVPLTDGTKLFIEHCAYYNADGPWDDIDNTGLSKNSDCKKIEVLPAAQPWDLKISIKPELPAGKNEWNLGGAHEALVTVETAANSPAIPAGVTVRALISVPKADGFFNLPLTSQTPASVPSVSGPAGWVCAWGILFDGALAVCQINAGAGGFTAGSFKVPLTPTLNAYSGTTGWKTLSGTGKVMLAPPYKPGNDVNQSNNSAVFGPVKIVGIDIGLQKTAVAKPWAFGSKQIFSISVANGGVPLDKAWLDPAKPITIEDKLAGPFKYVGHSPAIWTCTPPPGSLVTCSYSPGSGTGPLFPIPALNIEVDVVGSGLEIPNVATLKSGANDGPNVSLPSVPGKVFGDAFGGDNSASTSVDIASPYDIATMVTPGVSSWPMTAKPKFKVTVTNLSKFNNVALDIPGGVEVNIDYQVGLYPVVREPSTHPAWTCATYTPPTSPDSLFTMMGLKCSRAGIMPKNAVEDIFIAATPPKANSVISTTGTGSQVVWDGKTATGALLNCSRGRIAAGDKYPNNNDACFAVTITP